MTILNTLEDALAIGRLGVRYINMAEKAIRKEKNARKRKKALKALRKAVKTGDNSHLDAYRKQLFDDL